MKTKGVEKLEVLFNSSKTKVTFNKEVVESDEIKGEMYSGHHLLKLLSGSEIEVSSQEEIGAITKIAFLSSGMLIHELSVLLVTINAILLLVYGEKERVFG